MKKLIFLISLVLLVSSSIRAQYLSVGASLFYDEALQDYAENLDHDPIGLSIHGMYLIPKTRISIGADAGVAMYYSEEYVEDLSERGYDGAVADVYEEDCYFTYNLFARYNLRQFGPVTPYAEARIGGASYFTTKEYLDFHGDGTPSSIESEFRVHGTSLKTGIGGGLVINLFNSDFSLDLGATLSSGSKTNYRSVQDREEPLTDTQNLYRSNTHNVVYRFGGIFTF